MTEKVSDQTMRRRGKKQHVLSDLWQIVKEEGEPYSFHNSQVEKLCQKHGFSNKYDLTKIDSSKVLPENMIQDDVFIIHLGKGEHRFVKGIKMGYHKLEPPSNTIKIPYLPHHLDSLDEGESGLLSLVYNQGIVQHFVTGDRMENVRIHLPGRTRKTGDNSFKYWVGPTEVEVRGLQIEMDFIIEKQDQVAFAEAKRGEKWRDFSVSQIYLPFRKLLKMKDRLRDEFDVVCMFVHMQKKVSGNATVFIHQYNFEQPERIDSIRLLKSSEYILVPEPHSDSDASNCRREP